MTALSLSRKYIKCVLILGVLQFSFFSQAFPLSPQLHMVNGYLRKDPQVMQIGGCSATLIGPRVLLTAAHCAPLGTRMEITQGTSIRGTLIRPTTYIHLIYTFDVALIILDSSIPDIQPWSLDLNPETGDLVFFSGYGYTSDADWDEKQRFGYSRISDINSTHLIMSAETLSGIRPGDSGGPAYLIREGKPHIVGVNSYYRNSSSNWSAATNVMAPEVRSWMMLVSRSFDVGICGLTQNCSPSASLSPPQAAPHIHSCTEAAANLEPRNPSFGERLCRHLLNEKETVTCAEIGVRREGWTSEFSALACQEIPAHQAEQRIACIKQKAGDLLSWYQAITQCRGIKPFDPQWRAPLNQDCLRAAKKVDSWSETEAHSVCSRATSSAPVFCTLYGQQKGWTLSYSATVCENASSEKNPVDCVLQAVAKNHWTWSYAALACVRATRVDERTDCVTSTAFSTGNWFEAASSCIRSNLH